MRVSQLPDHAERLVAPFLCPVRIAQQPQGPSRKALAKYPEVYPIEGDQGTVLSGIIEGTALLKVL